MLGILDQYSYPAAIFSHQFGRHSGRAFELLDGLGILVRFLVCLDFRVKKVFGEGSRGVVTQGDKTVASFKRPYMISSKMEKVRIPVKLLAGVDPKAGPLVVSAVEETAKEVAKAPEGGGSNA